MPSRAGGSARPSTPRAQQALGDRLLGLLALLLPLLIAFRIAAGLETGILAPVSFLCAALVLLWAFRRRLDYRLRAHGLVLLLVVHWLQSAFVRGPTIPASAALAVIIPVIAGLTLGSGSGLVYLLGVVAALVTGGILDSAGRIPPFPLLEAWGRRRILEYWCALAAAIAVASGSLLLVIGRIFTAWEGLVAGLEREVAERRAAEDRLAASDAHLRAAFAQSAVGFARLGLDGRIREANARISAVLGYSQEELVGRHYLDLAADQDRERGERALGKLLAGEVPTCFLEKSCLAKSGAKVRAELTATLIRSPEGRPEAVFLVVEDVTERRRAEEEHRQLEAKFLHAQKMESLGRLAGAVAHDINNMLSATLGHAEILRNQLDPRSPLLKHLEGIEQASWRSSGIVRQLLAFSRRQGTRPERVDLNDRIAETRTVLAPLLGRAVVLSFRPGASLWPVLIDPLQLDQVLMNLAVNARDAMPQGGHLRLETANAVVSEEDCRLHPSRVPGRHVRFTVGDDGCGMDQATLDQAFEPFFTTKPPGQGTGLGLPTVFGIIKQAGGFVEVESAPGAGTTFQVYLPALETVGRGPEPLGLELMPGV